MTEVTVTNELGGAHLRPQKGTNSMTSTAHTTKQSRGACVHHWVIEEAKKTTSIGECKNCHEVKEFNNYVESRSEWAKSPKPFDKEAR